MAQTIEEMQQSLDAQEAQAMQTFRMAFTNYFDQLAALRGARQVLNALQAQDESEPEKDTPPKTKPGKGG